MRFAIFLAAAMVVAPALTLAQQQWSVTLTTRDQIPIGACSAVLMTVSDPAIRDVPRNRLGNRVTIADVDVEVTTPDGVSVAAQWIDSSHVSACVCQGATVGTVATVTATYPRALLAESARVAGVSFQKTTTFAVARPDGTFNPPACLLAREASRTGAVTPFAQPPVSFAPAPAPAVSGGVTALPGSPMPETTAGSARTPIATTYVAGPVTATLALEGSGSWHVPGAVTVAPVLSAAGSWYQPAPVTVTLGLSAMGSWLERGGDPNVTLQPAPLRVP